MVVLPIGTVTVTCGRAERDDERGGAGQRAARTGDGAASATVEGARRAPATGSGSGPRTCACGAGATRRSRRRPGSTTSAVSAHGQWKPIDHGTRPNQAMDSARGEDEAEETGTRQEGRDLHVVATERELEIDRGVDLLEALGVLGAEVRAAAPPRQRAQQRLVELGRDVEAVDLHDRAVLAADADREEADARFRRDLRDGAAGRAPRCSHRRSAGGPPTIRGTRRSRDRRLPRATSRSTRIGLPAIASSDVRIARPSDVPPPGASRLIAARTSDFTSVGGCTTDARAAERDDADLDAGRLLGDEGARCAFAAAAREGSTSSAIMLFDTSKARMTVPSRRGRSMSTTGRANPKRRKRRRRRGTSTAGDGADARAACRRVVHETHRPQRGLLARPRCNRRR